MTTATVSSSPRTMLFGVLALAIALGLFGLLSDLLRGGSSPGARDEIERAEVRMKNLQELQAANEKTLNGYSWMDKEKGIVRIPIEEAMKLEIFALNQSKPEAAYPIPAPAAAPAAP